MSRQHKTQQSLARIARTVAASTLFLLAPLASPVLAQQLTMETLLDRIQIEDFLTRYYYDLSQGESHALSEYFTEDALLDVDSTIAKGHAEIAKLYERPAPDPNAPPAAPRGQSHMLLTNPVITINGDTAIAHVIWTGVLNPGVGQVPTLYEQGREDTKLVKRNGKWLISERYISSDSGLPDKYDQTYEPRGNPFEE